MKNRKSLLSVILALAMVFTLCITPAAAVETGSENGATVTVETVKGDYAVDSEVTLAVSITGNPGFVVFGFTVKYDNGKLELTKAEKGSMAGTITANVAADKVNFDAEDLTQECTEDGVLFTLTFKVKADVADGTQVTLETTTFKNAANAKVPVTIVGGGINDTTGGNTTGGNTTGGNTTGGNTTGGNTTGGNTTGGNTTGGNTTGGNTTGGNTTGGNTTGGNTTGGNTTGGNTTGGNTTGGNTTGGNTTGGNTTGGNTTGGDTTDCKHDGAVKLVDNKDGKTHKVYCAECDELLTAKEAHVYQCNKKGEIIGKGGAYCLCGARRSMPSSTTTTTTGTTQSPKTGDMGVALYAATALLSLSGTAVVIKKRKDR